jgi:uncharacterized protein
MKKLILTALLTASFLAPAQLFAKEPTKATAAASASAKPISAKSIEAKPALWVVKDKDTTIYLFGTIHALRPNINWFKGPIKKAFDASSETVFELIDDENPANVKMMMEKGTDPDGPPLSKKLGTGKTEAYIKAMTDLGLAYQGFEGFEPWFVSMTASILPLIKGGYDPNSGVDKVLETAALKAGKKQIGLETMALQIGFFDTMPEDMQIAMLNEAIKEMPNALSSIDAMVDTWVKGRPDLLAVEMNKGLVTLPGVEKILLTDRNARWAQWIDDRMDAPGTVFIAVGAGHLAGKDSVQDFLGARKFKVKRVKDK